MARRPAVRHGSDLAAYEEAGAISLDPWETPPTERRGRRGGRRWRGSGGRWWVWVGRAILWAVLLVILVNGVRAPFERFNASDSGGTGTAKVDARAQFPSSAASAFALQFATVYLNYDATKVVPREQALRPFIPEGTDGQFGWNGLGRLQVGSVQVAGVDPKDANNAVVSVLARSADNKWWRLAIPVYAKDGALVISGPPALLPPPARAGLPPGPGVERDPELEGVLRVLLESFFGAYAKSDQNLLDRLSDRPGIAGLNGSVNFAGLGEINALKGAAAERTVRATVKWQLTSENGAAELEHAYELLVIKKADGKWYVRDVHALTQPATP